MVAGGLVAPVIQEFTDGLHVFSGGAVDNAAFPLPGGQEAQKLDILALRVAHLKVQIGPVEACDPGHGMIQLQQPPDILPHLSGGGGGIGAHHRTLGQSVDKLHDPQIAGPEILAPLGDTVGLVHCHEGNAHLLRQSGEALVIQSLRGHIQNFDISLIEVAVHRFCVDTLQGAVEKGRRNSRGGQGLDLVPHQRDQRGNHHRQSRQQQPGQLVAHTLTAAGGHDAQHIPAGQHAVDQLLLPRSEAVVAIDPAEQL